MDDNSNLPLVNSAQLSTTSEAENPSPKSNADVLLSSGFRGNNHPLLNLSQGESSLQPNSSHASFDEHCSELGLSNDTVRVSSSVIDLHLDANSCLPAASLAVDSVPETSPGLGVVSGREQGQEDGSYLQVDVVSISSDIVSSGENDINSNQDARQNSRRLFWDAFSRRSSSRHMDSPTLQVSTSDSDNLGSRGGRWLLDFSGDLFDDIGSSSGYLGNRTHSMNEQRRQSRSEILERLRGGGSSYEHNRRITLCSSGLHPNGTCSCHPLINEETTTRETITRIVMLAEALFEVLDEIQRQPLAFSISMVMLPAPEDVVNSFPLKNHEKHITTDDDDAVVQCYICLDDYEEGDKIRVLPCRHEYHMSCVDKWLKEIHGVCPLCRGDVCNAPAGSLEEAAP